jgi:hypothetical protein
MDIQNVLQIVRTVEPRKYKLSEIMAVTPEVHAHNLRLDILTALKKASAESD